MELVELMYVNNFLQVVLPDMEFFVNLGDWPLVKHNTKPIPILSWCGSADTLDIVMPTYDLTESTLETMGRYKPQSLPRFFFPPPLGCYLYSFPITVHDLTD